jgi:hypothetical protein
MLPPQGDHLGLLVVALHGLLDRHGQVFLAEGFRQSRQVTQIHGARRTEPSQHFKTASEVASISAGWLATAQSAAPRPVSLFNRRIELAEMKLYPARPITL